MFLLKADRDALGTYADKIDDELRAGSLALAHEGERLFQTSLGRTGKWVAEILAAPMNHSDREFIELDPKKVGVASTEAELKDRWRRRLELEVLERVAQMEARLAPPKPLPAPAGPPPDEAPDRREVEPGDTNPAPGAQIPKTAEGRESKARTDMAKSYAASFARMSHPGPIDAPADLLNAITASLDPHTSYLPPADKANFDIHMS